MSALSEERTFQYHLPKYQLTFYERYSKSIRTYLPQLIDFVNTNDKVHSLCFLKLTIIYPKGFVIELEPY